MFFFTKFPRLIALLCLLFLALGLRFALLQKQGLWADEIFSLAMASGHSLEQSAAMSDAHMGDFPSDVSLRSAHEWSAYLQTDQGYHPSRILRAVLLSDTSPPAYYLILGLWLQLTNWSDTALRLFSVILWLLTLPLLWRLGRLFGGRSGAAWTLAFAAFSPMAIYYSTEGRMYALLWVITLFLFYFSIKLKRGAGKIHFAWIAAATAGLLTHYFFIFAWFAMAAWVLLRKSKGSHPWFSFLAPLVLAALLWWHHLPQTLGQARLSDTWLLGAPNLFQLLFSPAVHFFAMFSGGGSWNDPDFYASGSFIIQAATAAAMVLLLSPLTSIKTGRLPSLFMLIVTACAAPILVDLWTQQHGSLVNRYTVWVLPVLWILAGSLLGKMSRDKLRIVLPLFIMVWFVGARAEWQRSGRMDNPMRAAAQQSQTLPPAAAWQIHSLPSGILGFARYLPEQTLVMAIPSPLPKSFNFETSTKMNQEHALGLAVLHLQTPQSLVRDEWLRKKDASHSLRIDSITLDRFGSD